MSPWLCRFFAACVTALSLFISAPSSAAIAFRAAASAGLASTTGPVTYRAAGTADINDGTSITPGLPAGTTAGDLLILITEVSGSNSSITTPAGWTLLQQANNGIANANGASAAVFYRIAPAVPTAPVVTNPTSNRTLLGRIIGFYNVDQSTPIGGSGIQLTTNSNLTNAPAIAGGVANQSMLVISSHVDNNCTSPGTPGAGWTQAFSSANTSGEDSHIAAHYITQTTSGTQAAKALTRTGGCTSDDAFGVQFVINGAPAGLTIAVPTGTVSGDVMIASVTAGPSGTLITEPSGWTLISSTTQSNAPTSTMHSYWKVASASEPANYTWSLTGAASTGATGGIVTFSGVDNAVPINTSQTAATGLSLTHTAPSVLPTEANIMLVTVHEFSSSTSNWTPPAGMTEAVDVASSARPATTGTSLEMNYLSIATPGPTGGRSAVAAAAGTNTGYGITHSIALSPAVSAPAALSEFRMEQNTWNGTSGEAIDTAGSYSATAARLSGSYPLTSNTTPAISGDPGTCRYGAFTRSSKQYLGLPSSFPNLGASGTAFTLTAWIRTTDNTQPGQRIFVDDENNSAGYGLSLGDGGTGLLRFYTRGVDSISLDTPSVITNNTWYFVAAVADVPNKTKRVYVFDTSGTLISAVNATWTTSTFGSDAGDASIGAESNASATEATNAFGFSGNIDAVRIYNSALGANALNAVRQLTHSCGQFDHLEISDSTNGAGLTCKPSTITVRACANADCSLLYTGGVSGSLTPAHASPVNWGGGSSAFTIPIGSSSVTKNLQVTTTSAINVGIAATPSPAPSNTHTCTFTGCTYTAADAGFLFTVPDHYAEVSQSVQISAVKKADNSFVCTTGMSGNRSVNFKCTYTNPASGNTLPVRVNSTALNTANNAAAACDATGQNLTLNFDSNGQVNATVQYADVGNLNLSASYTGNVANNDLGLSMTGNDSFIAAPKSFAFNSPALSNIVAGANFSRTVTALNNAGNATPNFGKESTPETATITLNSRVMPSPSGVNGNVSGTLGAWSGGVATASNLAYTEVGQITLLATLSSGSYLSSGLTATGISGTIGNFIPSYFDTAVTHGCSNSFTYSAQPFTVAVTAKNLSGAITQNYAYLDAGACTVCSKAVTLSDGATLPTNFNGTNTVAATSFAAGVGTKNTVAYTFPTDLTAPTSIGLRATDTSGVTSLRTLPLVTTEGSTQIRRGRLRLFNKFGSEKIDADMSLQTQYWSGSTWVLNDTDSCTSLASTNFNLVKSLVNNGSTITASAVSISGGKGTLTLSKPSPSTTGSVDVAVNLGAAGLDQSCLTSHGGTAANLPWLRSLNGSCAATYDRDPSARATFGIYAPETRRTIHVRELY